MAGLFMKPDFVPIPSTDTDIKIASIAWGWQLGFTVLTGSKAAAQAVRVWRRTHRVTGYVAMVWAEILSNIIWGVLTWLYLNDIIPASFWLFFVIVTLWTIELNCLIQIIVNRLALLIHSDRQIFWLKYGALAYVGFLNISVYVIWIPACLQYQPFHNINLIWDRIEKALYLVLDLGLNLYFIYLVKTKLISSGVTKYWTLFKFNVAMIVVSISMDILIIAMMQLQNPLLYMQFHPVAYMIKLNIEMSMAHLIGKIARSADGGSDPYSGGHGTADEGGIKLSSRARRGGGGGGAGTVFGGSTMTSHHDRRNSRAKFDPTASQIGGDDKEDIRYHAWVSTGVTGNRGRGGEDDGIGGGGDVGRDGGRSPGLSMVDEESGGAPPGYITKDTQVFITSEPVAGGDDSQRAPSESSSTRYLKS